MIVIKCLKLLILVIVNAVATSPSSWTPSKKSLFIRPNFRRTCSRFLPSGLYVRPYEWRDFFVIRPYYSSHVVDGGLYLLAVFVIVATPLLVVQFNYNRQKFRKAERGGVGGVMGEADRPNLRYYCKWDHGLIFLRLYGVFKTLITLIINHRGFAFGMPKPRNQNKFWNTDFDVSAFWGFGIQTGHDPRLLERSLSSSTRRPAARFSIARAAGPSRMRFIFNHYTLVFYIYFTSRDRGRTHNYFWRRPSRRTRSHCGCIRP